jgi:hypothetical protein
VGQGFRRLDQPGIWAIGPHAKVHGGGSEHVKGNIKKIYLGTRVGLGLQSKRRRDSGKMGCYDVAVELVPNLAK